MRWTVEVKLFYNIRKVKFLKILFNSMGKKIGKKTIRNNTKSPQQCRDKYQSIYKINLEN